MVADDSGDATNKTRILKTKRKGKGNRKPTHPDMINARDKAERALELRKTGMTIRDISAQVGYKSPTSAWNAIMSLLQEAAERRGAEIAPFREEMSEKCEVLWRALQPGIMSGDVRSIEAGVKVIARQCKILGLDAPTTIQSADGGAVTVIDWGSVARDAIERVRQAHNQAVTTVDVTPHKGDQ